MHHLIENCMYEFKQSADDRKILALLKKVDKKEYTAKKNNMKYEKYLINVSQTTNL
jgi:hypothetical protein